MCFPLSPSSSVALIPVSSINNDSGILTSRFKRCCTAPCTRRLTQSFYFYMFSDISKCHSTTTGKERLCHYRSLISSPLFRLPLRHIPDKRRVAPPAHHLSIFWLKKKDSSTWFLIFTRSTAILNKQSMLSTCIARLLGFHCSPLLKWSLSIKGSLRRLFQTFCEENHSLFWHLTERTGETKGNTLHSMIRTSVRIQG